MLRQHLRLLPQLPDRLVEALLRYALCGHNMAQIFELAKVYKVGKAGMTSLARAILIPPRRTV